MLNLPFIRQHAEQAQSALPDLLLQAQKAAQHVLSGAHSQRRAGTGEKFWQFREYDPGDRPQDIDWRQSAKTDRVFIRQKEWQTTQTAMIWAQNNENMDFKSKTALYSKSEAAKILGLALGIVLSQSGELITSLETGKQAGRSEHALENLGNALINIETGDLPDTKKIQPIKNSSVILIADFLAPIEEIETCFSALAGRIDNALIVQTLDPAELNMPYDGRIIFQQPGTGEDYLIENVEESREDYLEVISRQIRNVRHLCHSHRWNWVLHNTDTDIKNTLSDIHVKLGLMSANYPGQGGRA